MRSMTLHTQSSSRVESHTTRDYILDKQGEGHNLLSAWMKEKGKMMVPSKPCFSLGDLAVLKEYEIITSIYKI